jgi:hypothetical protein
MDCVIAGEVGDLAKSYEDRSAVGVRSGMFDINSPTRSLFRLQKEPKTPVPDSEEADIGVLGLLLELGI